MYILILGKSCISLCTQILSDRPLSDNFDERFLSAFGLGDPDNPLKSSSSASITNNRESKLEKQAKESPWLVW